MKALNKIFIIFLLVLGFFLKTPIALAINSEVLYLAATLYGEARGESEQGLQLVANTIMNRYAFYSKRAKNGAQVTVKDVCLANKQYSFWNDKKSWSADKILQYTAKEKKAWERCLAMAEKAISGNLKDITGGAMNYYASSGSNAISKPAWARNNTNVSVVGHHTLVRGVQMGSLKVGNTILAGGGKTPSGGNAALYGGGSSGGYEISASGGASSSENTFQAQECPADALTNPKSAISSMPDTSGAVIAGTVLTELKDVMEKIYKSMGKTFMLGHGLMCYAANVDYTCLGPKIDNGMIKIEYCKLKVPHPSYFLCGMIIYGVAFFLTMAIGMYFLDMSYKLGFALLFLPVSIGLWPFAPTKDKLAQNISIVVHQAMLFTFVAIGISYAVTLIEKGVLDNLSWNDFWEAIQIDPDELEDNQTKALSENFSLDSIHILVMAFSLIFGFKIVGSSINDYLNKFFSDGVFGSSSPMHHMGTQAVGYAAAKTVQPALSYAKDVATATAGRGLQAAGRGVQAVGRGTNRMLHGDFSDIKRAAHTAKNIGHHIANPRETYNKAMHKAGEKVSRAMDAVGAKANEAIQKAGNVANKALEKGAGTVVSAYDKMQSVKEGLQSMGQNGGAMTATGAIPVSRMPSQQQINQNREAHDLRVAKFGARVDAFVRLKQGKINAKMAKAGAITEKGISAAGAATGNAIAHGGGVIKQGAKNVAGTVKEGAKNMTAATAAKTINAANAVKSAVTNGQPAQKTTTAQVRAQMHNAKETVKAGARDLKENIQAGAQVVKDTVKTGAHNLNEGVKNTVAKGTAKVINTVAPNANVTQQEVRNVLHKVKTGTAAAPGAVARGTVRVAKATSADKTKVSLAPSEVLKGFSQTMNHPQKTYRILKRAAKNNWNEFKDKDAKEKTKLILSKAGQITARTVRETLSDANNTVFGVTGGFLSEIGKNLADNRRPNQKRDYWQEKLDAENRQKAEEEDERIRNMTLGDD